MYIPTPKPGFLNCESARAELEQLIAQPTAQQLRPCPGCQLPCNADQPWQCASNCNASCENAPQALSSEPELHPIESAVISIVFEITTLRLIQPCWSCEGHLDGRGELWKLPQISFYSASALYPMLINNHINRLKYNNLLNYPWMVTMVDYGQTWSPTYQIEPSLNQTREGLDLQLMQNDLQRIGENMANCIKDEARLMLASIQKTG